MRSMDDFSANSSTEFEMREKQRQQKLQRQRQEAILDMENLPTGPAIDNMLWRRHLPSAMPDVPILSILEFEFKPEVDLRDVTSAPRKLWAITIEYILSLEGCLFLKWGTIIERDGRAVVCLIQWSNGAAWNGFQRSNGFHPITDFLASNVWNRCIKLDAIDIAESRELQMVTVSFGDHIDSKERFESDKSLALGSGVQCLCYGWLEYNAILFSQQAVSVRIPTIFFGLFATDKTFELPENSLSAPLIRVPREVSRKLVNIVPDTPKCLASQLPSQPESLGDSIKWICGAFPGPRALEYHQGDLSQDSKVPQPATLTLENFDNLSNIVWLRLHSFELSREIFEVVKRQLECFEGYTASTWATDNDRKTLLAILTVWHSREDFSACSEQYHSVFDTLLTSSRHVGRHHALEHYSVPVHYSPVHLYDFMEINDFWIPNDPLHQQVFVTALSQWEASMVPFVASGTPPPACFKENAGGWRQSTDVRVLQYTSVVRWRSAQARTDWYANLYSAPYSRFGLQLAALKIGAPEGIQTRFLALQVRL